MAPAPPAGPEPVTPPIAVLPQPVPVNPPAASAPAEATADLYNCADFPSQAAAQAFLRRYPADPSRLDADRDGIACETNRAPFDRAPVAR